MTYPISIITPSYNQGKFIERTIQSVLNQNIPHLEYVIMDGGSTDNTIDILKKYQCDIQWTSEPDHGQAHAVNKGFATTQGEIIGWLNSDDVYYPNSLQMIIDFFNTHPEIDIVYCAANHIDENDRIINPYPTESWNLKRLMETCYICQPAVFFRRKIIEKYGNLNEKLHYCMDYEYWLRLANKNVHFYFLNKIVAGSRLHIDTKTIGSAVKAYQEALQMFKKNYKIAPERWIANYAHVVIENKKGIAKTNWRHPIYVSLYSMFLILRWNKKISYRFLKEGIRWITKKSKIKNK